MDFPEIARQFIGTKEIGNNGGFDNPYFEVLMRKLGWITGSAWCAYSAMLKWYLWYQGKDEVYAKIKHVLHPHVLTMWGRASASQIVITGQLPIVGAIACWRVGHKQLGHGHCGVVVAVNENGSFQNVEGNTSDKSTKSVNKQRNGDGEYERLRTTKSSPGWEFLGFIYLYKP